MSRACLHPALYRGAHRLGAVVQHLRDATRVTLGHPLFLGQVSGELGGLLEDEHKSYKVDVCEQLRDGWAALHRPGLKPALREDAEQVEQDGVVPVPAVQQSLNQTLVWCVRPIHTPFVDAKITMETTASFEARTAPSSYPTVWGTAL
jgi:hypothetical protein